MRTSRSRCGPTWVRPLLPERWRRSQGRRSLELRRAPGLGRPVGLAEAVADRPHRLDQVCVLFAELGPQPAYVDVHGPVPPVVLVAPYPAEERLAGEDLARSGGQEPEEFVLHVGEVEDLAGHRGLVGLEVEDERAVLQQVGTCLLYTSPSPRDRTRSRMPSSA